MPLGYNKVLGCQSLPPEARPHRVAIANWPAGINDPRTRTLESLLGHIQSSGYEGVEFATGFYGKYFPGDSPAAYIRKAVKALEKFNLKHFGTTLHVSDAAMREYDWVDKFVDQIKLNVDLGGGYTSYQITIHPDHAETGGAYREDARYLKWCADRVAEIREATWAAGTNFYLEVHVNRITEDPGALCRILDMATCELNGDMSHYLSRGFLRGKYVERILKHLGHTHVRMARTYGDLSAWVEDPKADWEAKGVTWQMFQFMKLGLAGGLSSRTIAGETGPMHLVKDTLTQDAKLVPLYRAMARYADASAQGIAVKVDEPGDLRPWG